MKTNTIFLIVLVLTSVCWAKYSGGTGEPNDPYRIATPNDLNSIGLHTEDMNKCFLMTSDINMIGFTGDQFNSIGTNSEFRGVFDGNNHTIYNFTSVGDFAGLFIWVDDVNAQIERVTMVNPYVSTGVAGAIIRELYNGKITNCHVIGGTIQGTMSAGGLCGFADGEYIEIIGCTSSADISSYENAGGLAGRFYGTIRNCLASGDVNGSFEVGGLVGKNRGTVTDCSATGDVNSDDSIVGGLIGSCGDTTNVERCYASGDVNGVVVVGGLIGDFDGGRVISCGASGDVTGGDSDVGGLVGVLFEGTIEDCYATGNVSGVYGIGGLVAATGSGVEISRSFSTGDVSGTGVVIGGLIGGASASISNCYSLSYVTGGDEDGVGGLCGDTYQGVITNCFFAGYVDSNGLTGAVAGGSYNDEYIGCFWDQTNNPDVNGIGEGSDPNVIGLPTEQMQHRGTFVDAGWDMVSVWDIGENQTYPFLRTHLPSDINKDGDTNLYDLAILALNWLEE